MLSDVHTDVWDYYDGATHFTAVLLGTVWAADGRRGDGARQLGVCA